MFQGHLHEPMALGCSVVDMSTCVKGRGLEMRELTDDNDDRVILGGREVLFKDTKKHTSERSQRSFLF